MAPKRRGSQRRLNSYRQQSLFELFPSSPSRQHDKVELLAEEESKSGPKSIEADIGNTERNGASENRRGPESGLARPPSLEQIKSEDSDGSSVGQFKFEPESSPPLQALTLNSAEESDVGDVGARPIRKPMRRANGPRLVASDGEDVSFSEADRKPLKKEHVESPSHKRIAEEASDSASVSSSSKRIRKRKRLVKKAVHHSSSSEDLLDGINEDDIIDERRRGPSHAKNSYLQNLERLKRKKKGMAIKSESELSEDDDTPIPGSRPNEGSDNSLDENEDNDMNEFIAEDDQETQISLPAEFSISSYQDLSHNFKIFFQYFVHLAVTSEEGRSRIADRLSENEYFSVALSTTRRKLADVRDTIASSVWRPEFKKTIQSYPIFSAAELDFSIPQCDACHLNRLSTVAGHLRGLPYDRKTFESESTSDTDDIVDDIDDTFSGADYNFGRFCARRVELYHGLCHWEYDLFHHILEEVDTLQHSVVKRKRSAVVTNPSIPDDISDADQIMDWLDERNVIELEWHKVKELMMQGRYLEADLKRGMKDSDL